MRYELVTPYGNLDTLYDYDISLNYSVNDILDLGKSKTAYSKTILLPGTTTNNQFFKQLFEVNIDNISFNPKKKLSVIVKIGGNDVIDGYLQLLNININNKDITYEVNIVGKISDLFNKISDLTLKTIDLSEYNHYRTKDNIQKSWSNQIYKNNNLIQSENGDGYVYPYIVRGNHKDIENMYVDEMYPAIFYKTVIDKIITNAGYSYKSEFLNSEYFKKIILPFSADKLQLRDDEVNILESTIGLTLSNGAITPNVARGYGWYYTSANNYFFPLDRESGTVTNNGQDLTFKDDSGQWEYNPGSTCQWTCYKSGRYDIKLNTHVYPAIGAATTSTISVEFDEGQFEYRYQMLLLKANGQTIELDNSKTGSNGPYGVETFGLGTGSHNVGGAQLWVDTTTPLTLDMDASDVYIEAGDRVVIRVGLNYPDSVKWKGVIKPKNTFVKLFLERSIGDPATTDAYSYLQIKKTDNELDPEGYVNMNTVLDGSMLQKDFLLNAVKMFNLIITEDKTEDGSLIIEPYDDYYASKMRVLDWDEELRLDNDSDVIITPMSELDYKLYSYKYTEDNDYYNNEYKAETNGLTYGEYLESVTNELSDKTSEVKVTFAPTPVSNIDIDNKIAPFFIDYSNQEYTPKSVKQRVLFWNGLKSSNSYNFYTTKEDNSPISLTQYPQTGMWDSYDTPVNTLEWGRSTVNYFTSTYFPNQTLFEKFHKTTLNQIKDLNSKIMEVTVRWTPKDMASFDFRDIIFLNGQYWRVNEIKDFNPINSDTLTTFVLYQIIDINVLNKYTVEVPTSNASCPVDITTKKINSNIAVYVSESGQNISADCCSQIGGSFVNGVCRVTNYNPEMPNPGVGTPFDPNNDPWGNEPWGGNIPIWNEGKPSKGVGGPWVIPINRPFINRKWGNTYTKNNKFYGENGVTKEYTKNNILLGDNITMTKFTTNSLAIGDGIVVKEDNAIHLKNAIIKEDGSISKTGVYIIDGGLDTVFPFDKTNPIEIIDGTIDSVRNIGGDSWSRPIIDGNPYE